MEKIIFEDLPSTKTPLNAHNLNKIQENAEVAIDGIDNKFNYSTKEQVIGTWIDGKAVYKKVIDTTKILINDKLNELSIKTCVSFWGMAASDYGNSWPIPNKFSEEGYNIGLMGGNNLNNIELTFGSFFSDNNRVLVIVEYTKTTD